MFNFFDLIRYVIKSHQKLNIGKAFKMAKE